MEMIRLVEKIVMEIGKDKKMLDILLINSIDNIS